ncbi:MAG: type II secretion system protein [Lacipirellulaceae bacterium]
MTKCNCSNLASSFGRTGFSMTEMLAVVALLGILSAMIVPRIAGNDTEADKAACHSYVGDIEIQAEIWNHNTGGWPAANLSDIGTDLNYFPGGLPTCPVDGSTYTIDSNGRVIGHTH